MSWLMDTYDQTVEFWSKEDAFTDAADAVVWGSENPDIVAKEIDKSIEDLGNYAYITAAKIAAAGIAVYFVVQYVKAKAVKAA